jgi:hypothetical protein
MRSRPSEGGRMERDRTANSRSQCSHATLRVVATSLLLIAD